MPGAILEAGAFNRSTWLVLVFNCIYNLTISIIYDPEKNDANIRNRGLSFELVQQFDWDSVLVVEDDRYDYGEQRFQALGMIDGRLHMVVFMVRDDMLRVISLRKANAREVARYEKTRS